MVPSGVINRGLAYRSAGAVQLKPDPLDRAANDKQGCLAIALEDAKARGVLAEQVCDCSGSSVSDLKPHNLRRATFEKTPLSEIVVLRHDHKPVSARVLPNLAISRALQPDIAHVGAPWELVSHEPYQARAHILIKKELHAAGLERRRSRAAANARQARMSSAVRSGNSVRISASPIPPAMYSKTSYTVIRVP
jgi:hypothetical protein